MKKSIIALILFALFAFIPQPALADDCTGAYGTNNCPLNFTIAKVVKGPSNSDYVENTTTSGDQTVSFRITVTNTSQTNLSNITIKDQLPSYVTYVSSDGNFDTNSKTFTYTIGSLAKNESKTVYITAKTSPLSSLPNNQDMVCVVNQASATVSDVTRQDSAQVCIQKPGTTNVVYPPVLNAKVSPPTGAEIPALLGLLPTALTGFYLRKKTK